MLRALSKLLLIALVATVHADEYSYDYDDDYPAYQEEYDDPEEQPVFTATPQDFSVEVNGDITFPCDVENLGSQVLMFKHIMPNGENKLLFVGDVILKPAYRFKKVDNSFILTGVQRRHAGRYACRIETSPVKELLHTLDVQYPASVSRVSEEVQRVTQGSSVTLECKADGNPTAAISWSRQQGHLPSGAQSEEGLSITLENVDRHVEGTYICTASNGVGAPASTSMTVEVEYPPEIITEQAILHTGEGDEAKLMCIVHGRPTPQVSWSKDGQPVVPDAHVVEHDSVHRHTLTIKQVTEADFGVYTCAAHNAHGERQSALRVTGQAKKPTFTSSPAGGEKESYTLTWETESYSPIIRYQLKYRKQKAALPQANVTSKDPSGWDVQNYTPEIAQDIITGPLHRMSHPIASLEPATDYEAKVAVENKFGWSEESELFGFYTRKEVAVGQSASSGHSLALSRVLWLPINLLALLMLFKL